MKLGDLLGRVDLTEKFVLQKFLCSFLQCSREELWTTMDREISDEIIQKVLVAYKSYIEDKKPLEYILGHVDFFEKEFFVNESTLIPRPETEYMITAVTEFIQERGDRDHEKLIRTDSHFPTSTSHVLLDIGTGCGVLGISVLLQNPNYFSQVVFSDYFENALEIAKRNFQSLVMSNEGREKKYVKKVQFLQSDLLDFLKDEALGLRKEQNIEILKNGNVILVANLPYIPEKMFEENAADNVKKWEPKPAFVGGHDGLDYYKTMLDQILQLRGTRNEGEVISPITMFLEMMTWQVDILRQLYGEKFIFDEVKTFHFNIRIVKTYLL